MRPEHRQRNLEAAGFPIIEPFGIGSTGTRWDLSEDVSAYIQYKQCITPS